MEFTFVIELNYYRDDGKGDIQCKYASKEDADKEPGNKTPAIEEEPMKEHINPALAAGDTSDIVEDESNINNNNNNNNNNNSASKRNNNNTVKENTTAKVEHKNHTICDNDTTKNSSLCQQDVNKTSEELNHTTKDPHAIENSTQYGLLWLCSKILDWWSYGYNGVWKLLRSGKCPVPWVSTARLYCNIGK